MLSFPQLSTGCLAQFPVRKRQIERTVSNISVDGREIRMSDVDAAVVRWELLYSGLSDAEKQQIEDLFMTTQGRLRTFAFVDPLANLLSKTGDFNAAEWVHSPLLALSQGAMDPFGGKEGWALRNEAATIGGLSQSLACPRSLQYCFSVYVRSDGDELATCTLRIKSADGQVSSTDKVETTWKRFQVSGAVAGSENELTFAFEVPAGAAVTVYGPQVEAQPSPSPYKTSVTGGVYPNTRFDEDVLNVRTEGMNNHSVTVRLVSRASR